MGCGLSKTSVDISTRNDGLSGDAKPLPVSDDASTRQAVQSKDSADRQPHAAPKGTTTLGTDKRTAQQRENSVGTKTSTKSSQMTIVHFNDVYNIEPREKEPVGGAARFATKLASLKHLNPLIVFSGDCLNPSTSEFRMHHQLNFVFKRKLILVISSKKKKQIIVCVFFSSEIKFVLIMSTFHDVHLLWLITDY